MAEIEWMDGWIGSGGYSNGFPNASLAPWLPRSLFSVNLTHSLSVVHTLTPTLKRDEDARGGRPWFGWMGSYNDAAAVVPVPSFYVFPCL